MLRLLAASFAILAFTAPALANETSQIKVSVAELHVKPTSKSRSTLRLGQGREVEVVATSDDGKWVQVRGQLPHWEDTIAFSGWIPASAVDLASGPLPAAAAPAASAGKPADAPWADAAPAATAPAAAAAPAAADKPADAPWADAAPAATPAPTPAPTSAKAQDKPASAADAWTDPGASATPAPTATPAPSSGGDDFFSTLK